MSQRNHSRSKDKRNFSIALPKTMIADLERIAAKETRSRNGQIEHFLAESVAAYKADQKKTEALPATLQNPMESHPLLKVAETSSPSTPARSVPTKYPKPTRRKA